MAFCNQCGAQLQDGATFCPVCGAQQGVAPQQAQPVQPVQPVPQQAQDNQDFASKAKAFIDNTADHTAEMDPNDIQQNKTMAFLSYFWLLFLVPIFAAPQSKFARFHANQGIVLAIAITVASIMSSILPWFIAWIFWFVDIAWLIYVIIGVKNVNDGKAKDLPIIGQVRILK
ncbi:MAG: zinc-ribbon domain-containing protein [Lachnospiraceae bacterium]|nr:zinc-ribbon domain-containing protein [Lachnospiraceae bacterium]